MHALLVPGLKQRIPSKAGEESTNTNAHLARNEKVGPLVHPPLPYLGPVNQMAAQSTCNDKVQTITLNLVIFASSRVPVKCC
jgi:hypothetical protein